MADAYIICATPRSGSTMLCDLLAGTGVAGCPDSFYRRQSIPDFASEFGVTVSDGIDGPDFDRAYLDAVLREGSGDTGMFGLRLMWRSVTELSARLGRLYPGVASDAARFELAFGQLRYLYLSREDKVAQAVSRLRAEQSGLWHRNADGSERERVAAHAAPSYDALGLRGFIEEAAADEAAWARWFAENAIKPIRLTYDQIAADPRATLEGVLSALRLDASRAATVSVKTARMADGESRAWAARYRSETPSA